MCDYILVYVCLHSHKTLPPFDYHPNSPPFTISTLHLSPFPLSTFHHFHSPPFTIPTLHLSPSPLSTFHHPHSPPFTILTFHLSPSPLSTFHHPHSTFHHPHSPSPYICNSPLFFQSSSQRYLQSPEFNDTKPSEWKMGDVWSFGALVLKMFLSHCGPSSQRQVRTLQSLMLTWSCIA